MTIEHAIARSLSKTWGVADPRPWSSAGRRDNAIGEIWYERSSHAPVPPALLLKVLLTDRPLSIQVHPNDAYAHSIGLANGKTEAWHVLTAASGAKVALGLKRQLTSQEIRHAVDDGSISDLVAWQVVRAGDTFFVPAGTIHAIGADLVIAEIQQRSDTTFRLFDHGRGRELHIDSAIAVANAGPAEAHFTSRLTDSRTLLASNDHFTFEKIDLMANSSWRLQAERETWLLVLGGTACTGSFDVAIGDAFFAQWDFVNIRVGPLGLSSLIAYTGGMVPKLLQCVDKETIQ